MTKDVFAQLILNSSKSDQIARTNMIKQQIRAWDVLNDEILALFYNVPREEFVPPMFKPLAFADVCLPLAHGQAMMTPKEEGRILQELQLKQADKILVLGADSGFMLVLFSLLGEQVFYIDNHLDEYEQIKNKIKQLQVANITCLVGNIHQGWQDLVPFDVIMLTGSLPALPEYLKNALALNGRLFVVIGKLPAMEAMIVTRMTENTWSERKLFETERPRMSEIKESESFAF